MQLFHRKHSSDTRRQIGTGLVEVLVALVVIGVGMLGIASLYVTTLQAKTTSMSRMKAVYLASDMADRIRANPTAGVAYVLTNSDTTTATDCASANCNTTQIAAADLSQWHAALTNATTGLTGVQRSISRTAATVNTPEIYTILISWTEKNSGTLNYSLPVQICDSTVTTTCR